MTAKENILKKIKTGLQSGSVAMPFPEVENKQQQNTYIGNDAAEFLPELFASEFIKLGGKFIYCGNEQELIQELVKLSDENNWQHVHCQEPYLLNKFKEADLTFLRTGNNYATMDAAITNCKYAVARLGSLIITSDTPSGRALPVYCPVHICVVYAHQLYFDLADMLKAAQKEYGAHMPSMLNIATGPSRTADIEKTLVVGVHGPKEVYVLFVDELI
jgi:L-lactate dehydrogenase complex protein LldG